LEGVHLPLIRRRSEGGLPVDTCAKVVLGTPASA
jgi:hypothetical protein